MRVFFSFQKLNFKIQISLHLKLDLNLNSNIFPPFGFLPAPVESKWLVLPPRLDLLKIQLDLSKLIHRYVMGWIGWSIYHPTFTVCECLSNLSHGRVFLLFRG